MIPTGNPVRGSVGPTTLFGACVDTEVEMRSSAPAAADNAAATRRTRLFFKRPRFERANESTTAILLRAFRARLSTTRRMHQHAFVLIAGRVCVVGAII